MNKLNKIAIALAALTCASAFAQSETYNPSWYVTPSVNTMKPDSIFGVKKAGEGLGLRWGKPLSQNWDIQFGPAFARVHDNNRRYEQITLGADWLYVFSRNNFRPFVFAGVGLQRDKVSRGGSDTTQTSPYVGGGVGFQYAFSDQWSTQLDWRRQHAFIGGSGFGSETSGTNITTLGLTYTFDKPVRYVAVVSTPPVSAPAAVIAAPAAPVVVAPPPAPRFERYTLSATELFEFDSAVLRQPQPKLDEIAGALNANPSISNVRITGYADRIGSDKYNLKLSLRRADSVGSYLTSKGINGSRISTDGRGEANPVVECTQRKLAALIVCLEPNRRVEVEQITVERRVN